jgi:hypothetical protein
MAGIPSPFSGPGTEKNTDGFDAFDSFIPAGVPESGPFLDGQDVLAGTDHAAFHRLSKRLFDERGVYDVTFGYNLARLNLDRRHPGAGYRYAVEQDGDDSNAGETDAENATRVLRAEFTPTTPFCPQSKSLTIGSYRAWNGEADRHEYDLVRVRVHPMHHRSESINEELASFEPEWVPDAEVAALEVDGTDDRHTDLVRDRLEEGETEGSESDDGEPNDGVDLSAPF